jgi:hypothetical protein
MSGSGVFLLVSNFADAELAAEFKATKGGYPHVTLVYTSSPTPLDLATIGFDAFRATLKPKSNELRALTLLAANVRVNEFYEEKTLSTRHDVLCDLSAADSMFIEMLRAAHVPEATSSSSKLVMRPAHVTHSIHYNATSAATAAAALRELLRAAPRSLFITGYTID